MEDLALLDLAGCPDSKQFKTITIVFACLSLTLHDVHNIFVCMYVCCIFV